MTDAEKARAEQALSAGEEEIARLVHDVSPRVIRALLNNRNLSEDDVRVIATRKNLPPDILEEIAKDKRWLESYPVRLALARNPKTPLSFSLSIARYLRLFDLAELSRSHALPLVFRHKIESLIIEKIPTMDLGIKKTLAKIASGNVLQKLIQNGYPEVVKLCLDNPALVEAHLYKIINHRQTTPLTITLIADHAKWSSRCMIKLALIRNEHTPLALSVQFMKGITIMDLRELYADPSVPTAVKPLVHRELLARGEQPGKVPEEEVYEINEEEMAEVEAEEIILKKLADLEEKNNSV